MFNSQTIEYLCDIIREKLPESDPEKRDILLDFEFISHQRRANEIATDLILKDLSLKDLGLTNINVKSDGN